MTISALSLADIIAMAYGVHAAQVIGPSWLTTAGFSFTARLPDTSSTDQIPEMMQALLVERFQMQARREVREQPAYELTVSSGGPKFRSLSQTPEYVFPSGNEAQVSTVQTPLGEFKMTGGNSVELIGRGMRLSMDDKGDHFQCSELSQLVAVMAFSTDRPVIDRTNLKGSYDLSFSVLLDNSGAAGAGPDIQLFDAIRQQLGLKITPTKAPIDAIVIDSIAKVPTEN